MSRAYYNEIGTEPAVAGGRGMKPANLDLFTHSPQALAKAYRIAADVAQANPFEDPDARQARARHYLAEAERLEAQTAGGTTA